MSALLEVLEAAGGFSVLDVELARVLADIVHDDREGVLLGVAVANRATREGSVCADLARFAGTALTPESAGSPSSRFPELEGWRRTLSESPLVSNGSKETPLVLDAQDRLYLRRHWEDEKALARALRQRAARSIEPADPAALRELARSLFGPKAQGPVDLQRLAAEVSAVSRLSVVAGGPGTGKTSTAAKIVALAIADLRASGRAKPAVLFLAPTGKAAARLAESTTKAKKTLSCPSEILAHIPEEAQTVHRALGKGRAPRSFRYSASRPLAADIVVLDEASMIDLFVMRHLVEAVPETARLILLGDPAQLSSVEAGAVLADITGDPRPARYSEDLSRRVERAFGRPLPANSVGGGPPCIDDAVVTLSVGHRFSESSAVAELARAVERGDADGVLSLLHSRDPDVTLLSPPKQRDQHPRLRAVLREGFSQLAASANAEEALSNLDRFRVLSAHRKGPLGVEDMNVRIEDMLRRARMLRKESGLSRPILVDRNDVTLDLYNGDVGVLFRESRFLPARAAFRSPDGKVRSLSPARLPPHEPAFSMSVHKSQGSEFDEVVVVLPSEGSPLLSRELLYTAVTRARRRVVVHATPGSVREAVNRRAVRASGLREALRVPARSISGD